MRRVREAVFLGIGILAGLALSGPAAQAVDYLQARPSNQAVYVDGQKVEMEAYFIHDNNFVMLRDIGEAVGFNVYWDGGAVQVESDKPYTGEGPEAQPPAPAAVTEESVRAALAALRERYPNGASWPSPYRSASGGPYHSGMNCAGWAVLCSDAAFGDLPWRRIDRPRWDQLRPGDLVEYDSDLAAM